MHSTVLNWSTYKTWYSKHIIFWIPLLPQKILEGMHQGQITLPLVYTKKKNQNNQTWYNYIDSSQSKHLLIVCCNRDQTSDIHGTLQLFTASWQNIEACMLVPITMYIDLSLTHRGWARVFLLIPYWSPTLATFREITYWLTFSHTDVGGD